MGIQTRSIVLDPASVRRTLNEAIRRFCRDVLIGKHLISPDVLEDATLIAERERIVRGVARRWHDWEVAFEPDDPPSAQIMLESGALTPAVVEVIDRFCREVLIPAGHLDSSDWEGHLLDAQKYAIARQMSRSWVSEATAE